jgi:hypothetical protein
MGVKVVDVKVILHSANPVEFDLVPNPPLQRGVQKNEFIFENDRHNGYWLNYILEGDALGYRFPDAGKDALYSAKGVGCPTSPGQWSQFKSETIGWANKVLVVRNLNEKDHKGSFGYTLRLTTTPHEKNPACIELDPGGQNKNGSSRALSLAYVAVGVGSALVTTAVLAAVVSLAGGFQQV